MITVMIQAVANMGFDGSALVRAVSAILTMRCGSSFDQVASSKQARAGMMVSQFRKERLPLKMRMSCKPIMIAPAIVRASRGPKANQGATSSASQLYQTPNFRKKCGRKWNHRLSGPGRGWVSK
jgi:hypothetical protein